MVHQWVFGARHFEATQCFHLQGPALQDEDTTLLRNLVIPLPSGATSYTRTTESSLWNSAHFHTSIFLKDVEFMRQYYWKSEFLKS
jgi:hypothetical protein